MKFFNETKILFNRKSWLNLDFFLNMSYFVVILWDLTKTEIPILYCTVLYKYIHK
jgi:hypothetical protein